MNHNHLAALHTAIIDAREGYSKAIEKAEDPDVLERLRAVDGIHRLARLGGLFVPIDIRWAAFGGDGRLWRLGGTGRQQGGAQ